MHPAPSLILFSTLSGLGFGLLAWLGLGLPAPEGRTAAVFHALGLGLASAGLVASTFHLGNPRRALRAFTQWRSSWLSREAWLASAALLAATLHAATAVLDERIAPLGWLAAGLCLATVLATSMIYASIRAVPRWHAWTTPATFLAYAVAGGALLAGRTALAPPLLLAAGALQLLAWARGDGAFARAGTTLGTATGLGPMGRTRAFEPPHTGSNYLLDEMAFRVGRRHARRLRVLGLALATASPRRSCSCRSATRSRPWPSWATSSASSPCAGSSSRRPSTSWRSTTATSAAASPAGPRARPPRWGPRPSPSRPPP